MKINIRDYKRIFFTSDWHLGHDKDFLYPARGCQDRQGHIDLLINGINQQASENDLIIHLGDMCLTSTTEEYYNLLLQINCNNIWSIVGNHDNRFVNLMKLLEDEYYYREAHDEVFLTLNYTKDIRSLGKFQEIVIQEPSLIIGKKDIKYNITLCHFPLELWNNSHHNAFHLCGHSHNSFYGTHFSNPISKRLDCGVESSLEYHNKIMFNWTDIKDIMKNKQIYKGDHHNEFTG